MHEALKLLRKIPKGKVTTYSELAKVTRLHPRVIGKIMSSNKFPKKYPCYKVILSSGSVGSYSAKGGQKAKLKLLKKDGIKIVNRKINLDSYMFKLAKNRPKRSNKKL